MSSEQALQEQLALPALREDLALHPGPKLRNGAPSWVIEDPARGRFFRIGWLEFELLSRWDRGDAAKVAQLTAAQTPLSPSLQEVLALRQFLQQHELALNPQALAQARAGQVKRPGMATQALHHYLMFRIPLINPDAFLQRCLPWFMPLLGRSALVLSLLAAALGLAMAAQQWDHFASTFVETLSLQGLLSYAVALVFAKVIHEFGHAFTAKSLGLRVPRMGVAFVLLLPMLYTDTGQTWRLTRRADRFRIAAAGMRIELMLAAWCTLAWSFLPDGALRGAMFFLATTSWLVTLAINASPFMRFDGYYMLSDATGIPNLHDEATRLVQHFLRTRLLGLDEPAPVLEGQEPPPWLLWFGLGTMVYRFFLFLGIAVMVYHYFFKALGIFLFAVEIWWFILRPIWRECLVWWRERARIRLLPALRASVLLVVLGLVFFLPWQGQVLAEGWVRSAQEFAVYPPRPAKLLALPSIHGEVVQTQGLARLQASELDLREARAQARIGALDSRLLAATGAEGQGESMRSTREQLTQQWVEVQGASREARQLKLAAPFAGELVDVAPDLMPGLVVSRQEVLGRVIDTKRWQAEVFVDEDEAKRLRPGSAVRAYLHGVQMEILDGRIVHIDEAPLDQLPTEMLAARYGGLLHTTDDANQLKPRQALYRVRVDLDQAPTGRQARLAAFHLKAERASLAERLVRGALSALVLQASF
jgi:putative peptide zinc metalloprotease protein